jgi:PAS domain S-box-containing protein
MRLVSKEEIMLEPIIENSKVTIKNYVETSKIRVIIVDDDECLLKFIKPYLEMQGCFEVETANSAKEGDKRIRNAAFDVVVSDYELPEKNGLQFLEELRKSSINIPFILFAEKGKEGVIIKALNTGAYRYVEKNGNLETICVELSSFIQQAANNAKSELTLKGNEERFRQVAENSHIWIWEVDSTGLYTYSSPAVENMLGFKPEEIVGKKHFYDLFFPDDQEELKQTIFNIFSQKQLFRDLISRNIHKNGKLVLLSTSGLPILNEKGNILGYRGTDLDITEQKETEEKLAESEEKYRDIFENARDAIYIHDLKGKVISINKVVQEYGFKKEQIIGKNLLTFVPKKYWPKLIIQFSQIGRGNRIEGEIEVNTPLGKRIAEYRTNPIIRGNKAIGGHAILRDTTDRKKIEEALLESQQKFRALFDANPEASVFVDNTFHIIEANSRFSKLFRYSVDEIKDKLIDIIVPKEAEEESKNLRRKILMGPTEIVTSRKRKDGSQVPLLMSAGPVIVDNKTIGAVMVYKDISNIITAQEELSKALFQAELLNEKLSVVGGFTRHDVRNKMAVINGNLYLAKKCAGDNTQLCTYLDQIKTAVSNVDCLLEFARNFEMLGSQELTITDIGKSVDDAASLFTDLKNVKIVNECRGSSVQADSTLTTIFYNLIDNSLKYGQKITHIRVYSEPQQRSSKIVYEDDGVGIDAEIKKQLFTKGIGKGTGYGLYLIKRTCEIYGWTVQETGQPGKGARFEFTNNKK